MMRLLRRLFGRKNIGRTDLSSLNYMTPIGVSVVINGRNIAEMKRDMRKAG